MTCGESCLPTLEREIHNLLPYKSHTLECQDRGSSHQAEYLGCTRPPWMKGYNTWTCIGRVHKKRMGHTQTVCTGIAWDSHMGSNMRKDSLVFLDMFFTTKI